MEPHNQTSTPTEQPIVPESAINTVPDAVEPDTSSSNVIQPAAPIETTPSAPEPAQPVISFGATAIPVTAPAVVAVSASQPGKKKTTLVLIVAVGVLVVAAVGLVIFMATMS